MKEIERKVHLCPNYSLMVSDDFIRSSDCPLAVKNDSLEQMLW